jgi:predicted nuclease of predicted toxin-antitoxin system
MKLLLDMNLPRELGSRLRALGHDCRHAGDVGLAEASDEAILEAAREAGETVLTHDLDYGHLLVFSGESGPSVVIFRLSNTSVGNLMTALTGACGAAEGPLESGAIVIIGDSVVRVRRLPVTR